MSQAALGPRRRLVQEEPPELSAAESAPLVTSPGAAWMALALVSRVKWMWPALNPQEPSPSVPVPTDRPSPTSPVARVPTDMPSPFSPARPLVAGT